MYKKQGYLTQIYLYYYSYTLCIRKIFWENLGGTTQSSIKIDQQRNLTVYVFEIWLLLPALRKKMNSELKIRNSSERAANN